MGWMVIIGNLRTPSVLILYNSSISYQMIHAGAKLFTQGQFPLDTDISKHQSRQRRIKNDGKVVNRGTQTSSKS